MSNSTDTFIWMEKIAGITGKILGLRKVLMDYKITEFTLTQVSKDLGVIVDELADLILDMKKQKDKSTHRDSGERKGWEIVDWLWEETGNSGFQEKEGHPTSATYKSKGIKSVRRLSDGEVFSVGDETNKGKITQFRLINDILCVDCGEGNKLYAAHISNLSKLPAPVEPKSVPLFKDFCGNNVFEGDTYYYLQSEWFISECTSKDYHPEYDKKRFKNKQDAEDYITTHQPCLSLNDVQSAYGDGRSFVGTEFLISKLKELIQKKIKG